MKRSALSMLVAGAAIAIVGSANAQNPFADLKKAMKDLKKEAEGKPAPPTPAPAPAQSTQSTPKTTSTDSSVAATKVSGDGDNYCNKVQTNPNVIAFVDAVDKLIKSGIQNDYNSDPRDILYEWILKTYNYNPKGSRFAEASRIADIDRVAVAEIDKCKNTLRDTKFLRFFANDRSRGDALVAAMRKDKGKMVKQLDASGNMVEVEVRKPDRPSVTGLDASEHKPYITTYPFENPGRGNSSVPAAAYALFLNNGDKALASVLPGVTEAIEKQFSETIAEKESDKKDKERAKQQIAANRANQEANYAEFRKGNYKTLELCQDIAAAAPNEVEVGLAAAIKPSNKLRYSGGTLLAYKESSLLGNLSGEGYVRGEDGYAALKVDKNTIWFGKENIAIKGAVLVVGKYVDNTVIKLTSGESIQSPVLQIVCISPALYLPPSARKM
jgi:hypothetical protein